MAADLRLIFWRIRLTYWLRKFRYCGSYLRAWTASGQECWTDYYHEEYSPLGAIDEDLSYAD